ncbi:MAG TPA: tagaturonate reductase [Chitinophagaceae bacterium]|nr:tagaturonate reductase [Chitinophagaceae bacterium]
MQLSKENLKNITTQPGLVIPGEEIFNLPEKILQFGTGVLLRGLPDYFIDKANRNGMFNGRIVVIKSTSNGDTDAFQQQDSLYTLCVRGIEDGKEIEETIINSSISRVLSANDDWKTILECAHNSAMQIIISNTTEVGIVLTQDNIHLSPPRSFPGKLLAFLYKRYKAFSGSNETGMVIIPTELLPDNGDKLRSIIIELAKMNKLENSFINWLQTANHFCNSLVDRIVPGKLPGENKINIEKKLGYKDELMIMAESFRLWAIESDNKKVKEMLSFSKTDDGVVITDDIEKFRELKLRLLNGTHTFSCGLSYLAGFTTVKEAMSNEAMFSFIYNLAMQEIASAIVDEKISYHEASVFAAKVMDRFRNPYLDHSWMNITVQYSSKMKMRNIPLILKYYDKTDQPPEYMALGFASYLLFMKGVRNDKEEYIGHTINDTEYLIQDDYASYFAAKWKNSNVDEVVDSVLTDTALWETDLSLLNGFAELVKANTRSLMNNGVMATMLQMQLNKITV